MAVDTTGKQQQTRKVRGIACYARDKPAPHTARRRYGINKREFSAAKPGNPNGLVPQAARGDEPGDYPVRYVSRELLPQNAAAKRISAA